MEEEREAVQNQMPNISSKLGIGEFTGRAVIFRDKGAQVWRAQGGIQF